MIKPKFGTPEHLFALLRAVHAPIKEDIAGWYPAYAEQIARGEKCQGGMYLNLSGRDGIFTRAALPGLIDQLRSSAIVQRKINAVVRGGGIVTSAEARFVPDDPDRRATEAVWLGASQLSDNLNGEGDVDAWTGDPELVDHLKITTGQLFAGRLTPADYTQRTHFEWPGIKEAIDFARQYGLASIGVYAAMRASIFCHFQAASHSLRGKEETNQILGGMAIE